jgi:hypothetical protein
LRVARLLALGTYGTFLAASFKLATAGSLGAVPMPVFSAAYANNETEKEQPTAVHRYVRYSSHHRRPPLSDEITIDTTRFRLSIVCEGVRHSSSLAIDSDVAAARNFTTSSTGTQFASKTAALKNHNE